MNHFGNKSTSSANGIANTMANTSGSTNNSNTSTSSNHSNSSSNTNAIADAEHEERKKFVLPSQYEYIKTLGKGSYGVVCSAWFTEEPRTVLTSSAVTDSSVNSQRHSVQYATDNEVEHSAQSSSAVNKNNASRTKSSNDSTLNAKSTSSSSSSSSTGKDIPMASTEYNRTIYHSTPTSMPLSSDAITSAANITTRYKVAIKKIMKLGDLIVAKRTLRELRLLRHFHGHANIISIRTVLPVKPNVNNTISTGILGRHTFSHNSSSHNVNQGSANSNGSVSQSGPVGIADLQDVYIVEDLMDTDMHHIIRSSQPLTDQHFRIFMVQALRALASMHSAHVIHRDLKPGKYTSIA